MERVQKILSNRGVCSRRKAEDLIAQQKVQVNGVTIGLGDKAGPTDTITVEGKTIQQQKKIYIKFNKPMHCVTAVSDAHKKTVMDFIKIKERIFPVGRLDENTSGLLILTNDGDYANNIMHPRYEINKTYRVSTQRNLSPP
ncbi:MAG: pseudouridine synthase, partial [Candidatus Woesearchaeota archaeon]